MKLIISILALIVSAQAMCQDKIPELPLFKAVCIRDKATGFNWRSGDWIQTNFAPGKQIFIQKIDIVKNSTKPFNERAIFCKEEEGFQSGEFAGSKGCYVIKEAGRETLPIDGKMCTEFFKNRQLQSISCEKITFHPDGNFIELPWHSDIDQRPKDDYKDSLILSVGKCSKFIE